MLFVSCLIDCWLICRLDSLFVFDGLLLFLCLRFVAVRCQLFGNAWLLCMCLFILMLLLLVVFVALVAAAVCITDVIMPHCCTIEFLSLSAGRYHMRIHLKWARKRSKGVLHEWMASTWKVSYPTRAASSTRYRALGCTADVTPITHVISKVTSTLPGSCLCVDHKHYQSCWFPMVNRPTYNDDLTHDWSLSTITDHCHHEPMIDHPCHVQSIRKPWRKRLFFRFDGSLWVQTHGHISFFSDDSNRARCIPLESWFIKVSSITHMLHV